MYPGVNEKELSLENIWPSLTQKDAISDRQMDEMIAELLGVSLPVGSDEDSSESAAVLRHMAGRDVNGIKKIISIRRIPEEGLKISCYHGSLGNGIGKIAMLPL